MILMKQQPDSVLCPQTCTYCKKAMGHIYIYGYASDGADLFLCRDCALQLSRKLLEDLCEIITGDRNG